MTGTTLILNRVTRDLWADRKGHIACIWDVSGLERDKESLFNHVRILRKGRVIGGVRYVTEIKERWSDEQQ